MIATIRKNKIVVDNFERFGEAMPDGRLTLFSDGKVYHMREAILLSQQLGRSLSPKEMKQFEVQKNYKP